MSGLKLYTSVISPVCRSVMLFLAANNIPYEPVEVELGQSGKNPELVAINPNVKMPCLDDDGFTMFESTAILRYLATKYNTPDHWYPQDIKARAKLDEALAWFPGNLRCSLIFHAAVLPKRTGQPRDEKKVAECTAILKKSLDILENYFLKDKQFVIGDQISIADLQFIGEVTQYWLGGLDIYKGRPNCERWVKACQEALAPHFDKLYQPVYEVRKAGTLAVQLDL